MKKTEPTTRNQRIFCTAALLLVLVGLICCGGGSHTTVSRALGMVSVNFDDGYASAYRFGLPILDAAGLKTTQYIISGRVGQPGYVTQAQILAMQANGHEIGAHTRTHPFLSQLAPAQMQDEINGSLQDLIALGANPTTFAYPHGDYNDSAVSIVKSAGFGGARSLIDGFNTAGTQPLLLHAKLAQPYTSSSDIGGWIDEAQSNGTWLVLVFHRVDETGNPISVPHELVQATADALVAKKARVVTMSQGLSILNMKP